MIKRPKLWNTFYWCLIAISKSKYRNEFDFLRKNASDLELVTRHTSKILQKIPSPQYNVFMWSKEQLCAYDHFK